MNTLAPHYNSSTELYTVSAMYENGSEGGRGLTIPSTPRNVSGFNNSEACFYRLLFGTLVETTSWRCENWDINPK